MMGARASTLTPAPHGPALLFFRGRGFLSWLIRTWTRSKYSHAAILMRDGRILESYPGVGVRIRHLSDWSEVEAFTIPGFTDEQWDKAIAFGIGELGCGYDWLGVSRFVTRRRGPANDDWFCSELQIDCIKHGGLELLKRIPAVEVSPQHASTSPLIDPAP